MKKTIYNIIILAILLSGAIFILLSKKEQNQQETAIITKKNETISIIDHISSFDSQTIYINKTEIPIGNVYRKKFFESYLDSNFKYSLTLFILNNHTFLI